MDFCGSVWLCEKRQNHLSPGVLEWWEIPTLLLLHWTGSLRRRPRSSRRGGLRSHLGGWGQPSWDSTSCFPALSQAQGLSWLGQPLIREIRTIMKFPSPSGADYYFLFLLLLWCFTQEDWDTLQAETVLGALFRSWISSQSYIYLVTLSRL